MKILDTARLALRTVEVGDAPFYLNMVNDAAFITHIGDRGLRTLAAARDAIAAGPVAMQAALGHSIYLVELKESGVAIGMSGLIKRDTLPGVDIGYAFLPAYRGQGYAYEAGAALVAHARDVIGLKELLAICGPANTASGALLEKLGLRYQGMIALTPESVPTRLFKRDL